MFTRIIITLTVIISLVRLTMIGWQKASVHAQQAYDRGYDDGAMLILDKVINGENIHYERPNGDIHNIELIADTPEILKHETDPVCGICHFYDTDYLRKEV